MRHLSLHRARPLPFVYLANYTPGTPFYPPPIQPQQGVYPHHIKFTEAMSASEFCFAPLGTHGGDPGKSKQATCGTPVGSDLLRDIFSQSVIHLDLDLPLDSIWI